MKSLPYHMLGRRRDNRTARQRLFYALAEPTRRDIVELLASNGQLSATDICGNFAVSPPAISQHLRVLREANLVQMEKRAQQRIYQLNPNAMVELEEWAKQMTQLWNQRFDALDTLLKAEEKGASRKRNRRDVKK